MEIMPNHFQSFRGLASRPAPAFAARAFMAALLLAATAQARAAEIEDGFYSKPDDASSPAGTGQNGHPPGIGKKQPLRVLGATVGSQDNANTRFELRVQIPETADHGYSIDMLALGGRVFLRDGRGSSFDDWPEELMFAVSGADNATNVARYFGVPVACREHPGYNLAVSFTPSKPEFQVGEEVNVTLRIQNAGSRAFSFQQGGRERGARDSQYTFVARLGENQVDDIGKIIVMGGFSAPRVVKPGEVFTDTILLNKWYAFDKPGDYRVLGSYYMPFKPVSPTSSLARWRSTIWEDYATGEFTVKIVPAAAH
jgi:hypothetical protein